MDRSIFFAWATENEVFDSSIHARQDETIFSLNIIQKEGEFASAILKSTIHFGHKKLQGSRIKAFISTSFEGEKKLLFVGYGMPVLKKIQGEEAEIELTSQPYNWHHLLESMIAKEKESPYWHVLLAKHEDLSSIEDYQDARTSSFYCNPVTGDIKRSDWFQGDHSWHLGERILKDSLQLRVTGAPLKACTVRLHAQWIQRDQGFADISRQLMRAFPGHYIHSFSGKNLKEKWPAIGQNLGRSGYWVVRSKLKKYHDFRERYYQKLSAFSSVFSLKDEKNQLKKYRLKRSYFKAKLWLGWQYQQKRKETLSLTLNHAVPTIFAEKGQSKTIDIFLNGKGLVETPLWKADHRYEEGEFIQYFKGIYQSLTTHQSSIIFEKDHKKWRYDRAIPSYGMISPDASFFLTDCGYEVAACGLEIAKQNLARSARCVEISFRGHWDDFINVTTDHSLEIQDERLPQGKAKGKVIFCRLCADGDTGHRYGEVTMVCSVGGDNHEDPKPSTLPTVFCEEYCQDTYQFCQNATMTSGSGISYYRYDDQSPLMGRGNLKALHSGDVLQEISVENHSILQEDALKDKNLSTLKRANQFLNQHPTNIRILLRDLRSREKIEHTITLKPLSSWAAPNQICLQPKE